MKKRIFALLLAAGILSGCTGPGTPDSTQPNIPQKVTVPAEEQIRYDWMAGESPVPNRRVGLVRQNLSSVDSGIGTYFIYKPSWILNVTPPSPWILYADHGSDTVIKLCGRPDCSHDTTDCNAFVENGEFLTFHNGYLYIFSSPSVSSDGGKSWDYNCKLLRINADGSNRIEVYDFTAFAKKQGADFASCQLVSQGYCLVSINNYVTDDRGQRTSETQGYYAYALDGSMKEPQAVDPGGWNVYNCGDVLLTWSPVGEKGGQYGSYYDYDIAENTLTYLTEHPGTAGYYDETEGYYFTDGKLHRLTYATGTDEVLMKTELTGDYNVHFFPDCFLLADGEINSENPDLNLYIYNWGFELVETVTIDYFCDVFMISDVIMGETPYQIILSNGTGTPMPAYYINKSELGSGKAKIHPYQLPDLEYDIQRAEEDAQDQQWLDEAG